MSVLNKMLRDIELRQPTSSVEPVSIPMARGRSYRLAMIVVICSILLIATYVLLFSAKPFEQSPAPSTVVYSVKPATDVVTDAVQPTDAKPDISLPPQKVQQVENDVKLSAEVITENIAQRIAVPAANSQIENASHDSAVIKQDEADYAAKQPLLPVSSTIETGKIAVARSEQTLEQKIDALTQQAVMAAQAGQNQAALQLWQKIQQLQPKSAIAYLAQARLWLTLGQTLQAENVIRQGLQQNVVSAELQFLLAQQAASRADWQQVDILLPAQFELSQHAEYYGLKATALQQLGQQQAALHWYQQLLQIQPQQARWWLGAALAYDSLQQHEAAQLHYRQALQWGENLSSASHQFIRQRLAAIE